MNELPIEPTEIEANGEMLQQAVDSFRREAIPTGPPTALANATVEALRQSELEDPRTFSIIPRTLTMKILTTAAGLFLLVGSATLVPLSTKATTSAYAQVIEQVREARSMAYMRIITHVNESRQRKSKIYIAADGRMRTDHFGNEDSVQGVSISDETGIPRIILEPRTKEATVMREPDSDRKSKPGGRGRRELDKFEKFRELANKPERQLGERVLDGRPVTGFVGKRGDQEYTIWIDSASGQLARIEYDFIETSMKGGGEIVDRKPAHAVLSDFQFNPELDDSLFSWEVPPGYTVWKRPTQPRGGEASIIEALRGYTQHTGGTFPASLTDWDEWSNLLSKDSVGGAPGPQTLRVMSHLGAISTFLDALPKDEYAYLGSGKSTEDKGAMIFWYKKPDGVYRAIYDDLMIKDVTVEDVAIK